MDRLKMLKQRWSRLLLGELGMGNYVFSSGVPIQYPKRTGDLFSGVKTVGVRC